MRGSFAAVVAMLAFIVTLLIVPLLFAKGIPKDRQSGALFDLLTTRLNAFEIITGRLFSGLVAALGWIAVAFPLLVLLEQLGGGDLRLSLMVVVGMASWAFVLAALALAIAVESRTEKQSAGLTASLMVIWLEGPFILAIAGGRLFPSIYAWVRPVNLAILAAGPGGVLANLIGFFPGPSLEVAVLRMTVSQTVLGGLLIALAVARLRPASRRFIGGGEASQKRQPTAIRRRPPCGDNPMDWKERYTCRPGLARWMVAVFAYGVLTLVFGYTTYFLARPAWAEMWASSFQPMTQNDARWQFNQFYLRPITGMLSVISIIMISAQTSEMFEAERKRASWLVLLTTPLTGPEILGAKRSAVVRRWWAIGLAPLALALIGLVVGSVHPLGALAGAVAWWTSVRFASALGGYSALCAGGEGNERPALCVDPLRLRSCLRGGPLVPGRSARAGSRRRPLATVPDDALAV